MARPCHSLHAELASGCHWCDLYRTDAAYRALWDGTPVPHGLTSCIHLGKAVPMRDRRQHFECEQGHGVVAPCCHCGPKCADYQPDD